jgi:hypothetical protein
MTYTCKDDVMVPDGTLVYYHGFLEEEHGFCMAYRLGNGLYQLEAAQKGHPIYHGVGRERFTVVPVPDIPEPALEPGFYKSEPGVSNKMDHYAKLPNGKWLWVDLDNEDHELIDEPVYSLRELIPWENDD